MLASVGWIWPAYIQNDTSAGSSAASRLHSQPEDLAGMLLERYRKVPIISEAQAPIAEAIEAA